MSFPLCPSRKPHTCFLLMASIEKKKASERERVRECVHERERGRTERKSKNVSNRLFLFSSSFTACTITSSVMWPSGSLCRSSSSDCLHRACSVSLNCDTNPFPSTRGPHCYWLLPLDKYTLQKLHTEKEMHLQILHSNTHSPPYLLIV